MTISRFTCVLCLLTCFLSCFSSEDIINITAKSGERVTLPCRDISSSSVTGVEWIRPEMEPAGYFYLSQDGRYVPDNQHPYGKGWMELKDNEMKDGDASLILKNAMPVDSGTYHCYVSQGGTNRKKRDASDRPISIIHLTVEPGHSEL